MPSRASGLVAGDFKDDMTSFLTHGSYSYGKHLILDMYFKSIMESSTTKIRNRYKVYRSRHYSMCLAFLRGDMTKAELSRKYKLSPCRVAQIINARSYKIESYIGNVNRWGL